LQLNRQLNHSHVFPTSEKFNFPSRHKNNLKFLVDSGASLSILPHTSMGPPTGPHLVGANGKPIPTWGFRRHTICFSGPPPVVGPRKTPHRRGRIPRHGKSRCYSLIQLALGVPAAPGSQEGWVLKPLQRPPLPDAVTIPDRYPLPNMQSINDRMAEACDLDAQMSGIKILKGNEILRPVYKKPFSEILSGCFHFGLFSSYKVHNDPTKR
jgi:hypothetical protein